MEPPATPPYTLVTTSAGVRVALRILGGSRFLLFDCEGHQLGCAGGALSLLSIGTEAGDIFVFDALALGRESLLRVVAFVADGRRRKYVWDGRKDYSELRHGFRHRLANVVDLQIADITSRARRKHGAHGEGMLLEAEARLPAIHHLLSLKRVLSEHGLGSWAGEGYQRHDAWMVRPLAEDLLQYAVRDIILLGFVREEFKRRGYLDSPDILLQQSARYMTLHDRVRPAPDDLYKGSHLLPLEILLAPAARVARSECTACLRNLTQRSFSPGEWKSVGAMCRVCRSLTETRATTYYIHSPPPRSEDRASSPNSDTSGSSRSDSPLVTPTNSPPPATVRLVRHSCPPQIIRDASFIEDAAEGLDTQIIGDPYSSSRSVSLPHLRAKSPMNSFAASTLGAHAYWAVHPDSRNVTHDAERAAAWRTYICSNLVRA